MFSKLELTDREDIKILKELEEERAPKKRVFDCRRAQPSDIGTIMGFVTDAQAYLKSQGVDQWQYGYPTPEHFLRDMEEDGCWLFFCDGEPAGAAAILTRPEEAYRAIEGKWLTEGENYCAVHRACISSAFRGSGLSREMFSLAEELARGLGKSSVRVDTHRENLPMQGVLRKCGYAYCGVIHIIGSNEDGAERLAFEKIV